MRPLVAVLAALVLGSAACRAARAEGSAVAVSIDVATDGGAGAALTTLADGASWSPALGAAGVDATLRLVPGDGGSRLEASLVHRRPALVDHEVVSLRLPGRARVIGHDLRLVPLTGALRVDRPTPVVVVTPDVALVADAGIVAARYEPRGDATVVELVLDDRASHPFSVYERCLERLPSPPDWHALERRRPLDRIARRAGERVEARATLYRLRGGADPVPLVVERWPAGARAALVVTDHADRTDPAALRALLYGTSDGPPGDGRGLVGRGLRITKTFFARGGRGALADDAEARALADALAAGGGEVGAHSITDRVDARDAVRDGLAAFDPWRAVTWIDHEPYTNCEAVSSEGWQETAPYGIRDLLLEHGYRWVWAATDVKEGGLDLVASGPPIFPLPADPRLWVFRSTWFAEPPAELARIASEQALDALERDRGLAVLHTYLSASPATTPSAEHRRLLVVRPNGRGGLALDPGFADLLGRLAARAAAGTLLVAPWRDVGDRLRALADVVVRYGQDGGAVVENAGAADLRALTLTAPGADAALAVTDATVLGVRSDADGASVWFDLPAHARATVHATRGRTPVPFLPLADVLGTSR